MLHRAQVVMTLLNRRITKTVDETPSISNQDANLLRSFLVLSEDDLYAQLGQANWLAAAPPSSRSDLLSRGKELVAERKRELQKSVCDNAAIRELADGGDNYQIAIAVFGVVLTSFAHITTASAAILAALISKKGIRWLCNPVWNVRRRRDS
jgi:hypothetical protein